MHAHSTRYKITYWIAQMSQCEFTILTACVLNSSLIVRVLNVQRNNSVLCVGLMECAGLLGRPIFHSS